MSPPTELTPEIKRVLERVRKMLALANDAGASEGERDNALRMAHATLAKYNLDLAQATATTDEGKAEKAATEPRVHQQATFFGRPWARCAASAVGDLLFCHYLYVPAKKGKDTMHYFIGSYANSVTASLLAEFVVNSIYKEGKRRQRSSQEANAYFVSFCWGAARAVQARVLELEKAAENQTAETTTVASKHPGAPKEPSSPKGPGTALVTLGSLVQREEKANLTYVQQNWRIRGSGRYGQGAKHSGAYDEGKAYGRTINLSTQVK